jgi:hypothetical protein
MKLTLFLAVSLALNAIGACLVLLGRNSTADSPSKPTAPTAAAVAQPPAINADVWPALDSAEAAKLIERLEKSGFPSDIIRALISAQIREQHAARRKALLGAAGDRPFWKDSIPDPKTQMALRELDREHRKQMRELFGDDAEAESDSIRNLYQTRTLSFLPSEKADEIRRLMRDHDERRSDMFASGLGGPIDREKTMALEKERDAAIAQLLSPDELREYNVRNSYAANSLREQLTAFNPTEEEFRTIFKLREPFEERFDQRYQTGIVLANQERMNAEKALNDQIKAALAPARAAEYDRAIDFNYRRTSQLVSRLELPPETAANLWAVQQEFLERRRSGLSVTSPEERRQQLAQMQQEAVARVTPLLGGAQNVEVYKQYGGSWLDSLVPRTRPMPAK